MPCSIDNQLIGVKLNKIYLHRFIARIDQGLWVYQLIE